MKIFTRYVLHQFLKIFLLTLAVMTAIFLVIHLMDRIDEFVRSDHPSKILLVVLYFMYKIPISVYQMTPMAILLASLLTLGSLYRSNEIIVLKSCGMSLIRISLPILAASAAIGVVSFLNSEHVIVDAKRETNRIFYEDLRKVQKHGIFKKDRIWLRSNPNYVWNIRYLDTANEVLNGITLYELNDQDGSIKSRLDAEFAFHNRKGPGWWFRNAAYRQFDENRKFTEKYFRRLLLDIDATVEDFLIVKKDPDEMTFKEIREYVKQVRADGYDDTRYVVDMQLKIAFPAIGLVMALIAVPFGETLRMRGGHLMGVGLAVIIGSVFWFIFSMAIALGHSGKLPSLLSAYGAHLVFGFTAVSMLLTNKQ